MCLLWFPDGFVLSSSLPLCSLFCCCIFFHHVSLHPLSTIVRHRAFVESTIYHSLVPASCHRFPVIAPLSWFFPTHFCLAWLFLNCKGLSLLLPAHLPVLFFLSCLSVACFWFACFHGDLPLCSCISQIPGSDLPDTIQLFLFIILTPSTNDSGACLASYMFSGHCTLSSYPFV